MPRPKRVSDEAIIYQLEKVDQGGDITDILESRMAFLASEWGYEIEDDETHDHYGDIRLPDGRHAGFEFHAVIRDG